MLHAVAVGLFPSFLRCDFAESETPTQSGSFGGSFTWLQVNGGRWFAVGCGCLVGFSKVVGWCEGNRWCGVAVPATKAVFTRAGDMLRITQVTVDVLMWLAGYEIVRRRGVGRISSNMRISGSVILGCFVVLLVGGFVAVFSSGSPGQERLHK